MHDNRNNEKQLINFIDVNELPDASDPQTKIKETEAYKCVTTIYDNLCKHQESHSIPQKLISEACVFQMNLYFII